MIIDNVGFDEKEMAKMSEKDFINTHLSNDAIAKGKSDYERKMWLRNAFALINPKNQKSEEEKEN